MKGPADSALKKVGVYNESCHEQSILKIPSGKRLQKKLWFKIRHAVLMGQLISFQWPFSTSNCIPVIARGQPWLSHARAYQSGILQLVISRTSGRDAQAAQGFVSSQVMGDLAG